MSSKGNLHPWSVVDIGVLQFYAGSQAHPTRTLELAKGSPDKFWQLVAMQTGSALHSTHTRSAGATR